MTQQVLTLAGEAAPVNSGHWQKRSWPTIVALLIGCNSLAFYLGSKRSAEPPRLVVDEQELAFGDAAPVADFEHSITFHNPTAETIEATLTASCKCMRFDPRHVVIPPGQSQKTALALNLVPLQNAEALEAVRPFDVDIVAELNGPRPGKQRWTLTGQVKSPVTIKPGRIGFDRELVRGSPFVPHSVLVRLHQPGGVVKAECDSSLAECVVTPVPGKADEFRLQVLPSTELPDGPFQFFVGLVAVTAVGQETIGIPLRVGGTVWPEVRLSPSRLDLGAMRQGTRRSVTVELQSRSGREFTVTKISGPSAVVFAGNLPRDLSRSHTVQIEVACGAVAAVTEELDIELQIGEDEPIMISLPVSFYGVGEKLQELKSTEQAAAR